MQTTSNGMRPVLINKHPTDMNSEYELYDWYAEHLTAVSSHEWISNNISNDIERIYKPISI